MFTRTPFLIAFVIGAISIAICTNAQTKVSVCDPTYPQRCSAVTAASSGNPARSDVYTSDQLATGTITGAQSVTVNTQGRSNLRIAVSGTWSGTLVFEGSVDGTNWIQNGGLPFPVTLGGSAITATTSTNGAWEARVAGLRSYRMRGIGVTGTATVVMNASVGQDYAIANLIDDAVSILTSTAPLPAGGSITTGTIDMKPFVSLDINFEADVATTTNGCVLESSVDGTSWVQETSFSYDNVHPEHLKYGRRSRYMRFTYTNGTTPQTRFQFQVFGQRVASQSSTTNLTETLDDDDTAMITRSVITGRKTSVGNGYSNVTVDPAGALNVNTGNLEDGLTSASGKQLVTDHEVQVSLLWPHGVNTRVLSVTTANGGTFTQNITAGQSAQNATSRTSVDPAGAVTVETRAAARFTAQQSIRLIFAVPGITCALNNRKVLGVGTATLGYFIGCDPATATFGVMYRNSTGDHWIPRASWNANKLDGSAGQITSEVLDPTKTQTWVIDYRMGSGLTQYFVQFPGKDPTVVHQLQWRNTSTASGVSEGFLPFHVENVNVGSTADNVLTFGPAVILAETGSDPVGVNWAYSSRKNGVANGVATNLFSLRNNVTWNGTGGPATNRVRMRLYSVTAAVTGGGTNATALCELVLDPTLGGSTIYTDINANNSVAAVDVAGTTVSGGATIANMALTTGVAQTLDLASRRLRLNPGEVWTFACQGDGATVDVRVGASWQEEW